jgi:hypothetical protein
MLPRMAEVAAADGVPRTAYTGYVCLVHAVIGVNGFATFAAVAFYGHCTKVL